MLSLATLPPEIRFGIYHAIFPELRTLDMRNKAELLPNVIKTSASNASLAAELRVFYYSLNAVDVDIFKLADFLSGTETLRGTYIFDSAMIINSLTLLAISIEPKSLHHMSRAFSPQLQQLAFNLKDCPNLQSVIFAVIQETEEGVLPSEGWAAFKIIRDIMKPVWHKVGKDCELQCDFEMPWTWKTRLGDCFERRVVRITRAYDPTWLTMMVDECWKQFQDFPNQGSWFMRRK